MKFFKYLFIASIGLTGSLLQAKDHDDHEKSAPAEVGRAASHQAVSANHITASAHASRNVVHLNTFNANRAAFAARSHANANATHNSVAISRAINRQSNVARSYSVNRSHSVARNYSNYEDRDHDHDRNHHDRDWWQRYHRHDRVVVVNGGYLYNPFYYDDYYSYEPTYYYDPAPVYYGSSVDDSIVVEAQRELRREGYYHGAIDGVIGPGTRGAVAAFQRDNGLAPTGRLNDATLESLGIS